MRILKKVSGADCNWCAIRHSKKGTAKLVVDQISGMGRIAGCYKHVLLYSLHRFKWFLNRKSHYRLEDIFGKWWIR